MKFAVVVFPGSNCDHDAYHAAKHVLGQEAEFVWHKETSLARRRRRHPARRVRSRRLPADRRDRAILADHGGGQGVCRRGKPGARRLQRLSDPARIRPVARSDAAQSRPEVHLRARALPRRGRPTRRSRPSCAPGQLLRIPINHGEGNYFAPDDVLDALERERRVIFRYVDASGEVTDAANPNGAARNIAGICSERRNVVGMMPHPGAGLRTDARKRRRPGAVRVGRGRADRRRAPLRTA